MLTDHRLLLTNDWLTICAVCLNTLRYAMLSLTTITTSHYTMPCYAMLCHAVLCCATPCHAVPCCAVRCYAAAGITVIVSSRPCQAWDQEIIKSQNLDPLSYDYLVLKSAVHFRGDFSGIASHIVEVTGPVSMAWRRRQRTQQDYCPPFPFPLLPSFPPPPRRL
jgi:hypothetical protein